MTGKHLVISQLDRDASLALLERHHLGRLAFAFKDRVDIEPISYVYADGWLYLRTSHGTKLTTVSHHPYVAFEVDEIQDAMHWSSVVARGTIYFLDPDRSETDAAEFAHAVEVLRTANGRLLTPDDPAPHRRSLFRIHIDEITGRAATASRS
jgi:nitroimidazol reductase NimA-like FMN-containing flavoprotein (pyridoxamine 5'-phosphate oxidase superfamily)